MKYKLYVDASKNEDLNIGASGFILYNENFREIRRYATLVKPPSIQDGLLPQECELISVIIGLSYCKYKKFKHVEICYDCSSIEDLITGKQKVKTVSEKSYVKLFKKLTDTLDVKFNKVKAHSDEVYNNEVDKLCKNRLKQINDDIAIDRLINKLMDDTLTSDNDICKYISIE